MEADNLFRDSNFEGIKSFKLLFDVFVNREVKASLNRLQSEGLIEQDADGKWVPTGDQL